MTHYMRPFRMAPKVISKEFIEGWNLCQLEILDCRKVPWPSALVEDKYGIEDFNWPPNKQFAYECKINLLTGRTHQIRAQLAECGAPIVGDSMYMPAAIAELTNPGLNPFGNYKKQFESEADRECAAEEWDAEHGKEPGVAIGSKLVRFHGMMVNTYMKLDPLGGLNSKVDDLGRDGATH